MSSVNKVTLIGYLGTDPEVRMLPSGDRVANLRLATHEYQPDGSGGYRVQTEWHRVAFYGRHAEIASKLLKSGSQVYVDGRLRSTKWTDRQGADRKSWIVIGDRLQVLGKVSEPRDPEVPDAKMAWLDGAPPSDAVGERQFQVGLTDDFEEIPF